MRRRGLRPIGTPFLCHLPHRNTQPTNINLQAKVFHIPFIQALPDDFTLHSIVQRSPSPSDDAAKDHPTAKTHRSIDDVYADAAVDLVILCTIPETHFDMCKRALESGKHVVVEKPFLPSSAQAEALMDIERQTGKRIAVYQNRRWDADFLTLREILAEGALGDIAEFQTHFDRHRPDPPPDSWKAHAGPAHGSLFDLGSHLLDQVYHLFGKPTSVTAFVGHQRRGVPEDAAPDSFTALLEYPGPMLVTAKAGVVSPEPEQLRYWVRGTKGSFRKSHLDVQEDQLKAGVAGPGVTGFGEDPEGHFGVLTTTAGDGSGRMERRVRPTVEPKTYVEFYRILGKALRGEGEVPVSAEEGRDLLVIIEAAERSSREGRKVVL